MKKFLTFDWLTPKKALLITIVIFGFLLITNGEPYVRSDGFCYFTIDKSIIDQNSFISTTEPEYWDYMGHVKETFDGKYISVCSPGAALFNLPGLIIADLFKGNANINNDYFIAYNGHTLLEGIAYLFTAMIVGLSALVLIYKTLRRLKFSEKLSMFSTGAFFLCSYALWYIFLYPAFTHIYEIFGVALTLYGFVRYLNDKDDKWGLILTGVGVGISVMTRPVLLPIGIAIGLYLIYKRDAKGLIKTGLAGAPFALVYFAYNLVSYGSIITSGYGDVRGENFNFSQFHGLDVLFSAYRGVFIFTPLLFLSVAGLIVLWKRSKFLSFLGIFTIVILACIYGFWAAWWGGGSYGSRFMMAIVPFGCIGLASFLKFVRENYRKLFKWVMVLATICILYSGSILIFYRVTPVGSGFYTPLHFFKTQFEYFKEEGVVGYIKDFPSHIQDGSGILALITGVSDYVVTVRPDATTGANTLTINLKMFAPPRSTQPLPTKIEFYIADKATGKIYVGEINNFKPSETISLMCTLSCTSSDSKFNIIGEVSEPTSLPVSDYVGITDANFNFFFKQGQNIQFRGNLIVWTQEDPNYILLN